MRVRLVGRVENEAIIFRFGSNVIVFHFNKILALKNIEKDYPSFTAQRYFDF